ncbi:hypothetical protein LguiB_019580 [Lonicera macranthoides]
MPQDILDYIWKEVEDNTNAPPEYRENCLKNVGDIWRKWKSQVKTQYYDIWETPEQRLNNKPLRVVQDQWEILVAYWGTEKQQVSGVTPQVVFSKGNSTEENKFNKTCEETRTEFNTKLDQLIRERDAEINRRIEEAMMTIRAFIRDEVLAELRGGNGPSNIGNVTTSSSVHRPNLDLDESFSRKLALIQETSSVPRTSITRPIFSLTRG